MRFDIHDLGASIDGDIADIVVAIDAGGDGRFVYGSDVAEFIPDGVRRRRTARPDACALCEELRVISLRSAARLQDRALLTDTDLYDENGLPA